MNHNSPAAVRETLSQYGLRPKKRWGQNFMLNPRTREKLVATLDPQPGDLVWEIGPGLGALTSLLVGRCRHLLLFEVDHGLIRFLMENVASEAGVSVVAGDFLDTWQQAVDDHGKPNRIIGNLPFSASSAIIAALLENQLLDASCILTVQKELAERVVADTGSRNYSSFSVLCQCLCVVADHGELAPGTFYPVPEVTSAVVELQPRTGGVAIRDRALLFQLIRTAFASRRKTLRNNLLGSGDFGLTKADLLDVVEKAGIDVGLRAEELTPDEFIRVANALAAGGARPAAAS